MQALSRPRMCQAQLARMKTLTGCIFSVPYIHRLLHASVDGIAEQRMPDVGEMDADLMGSSGFQDAFHIG